MYSLPKILKVEEEDPELTQITWMLNNICPNSCSYCPEGLHLGSNHNYDWNNARQFIKELLIRFSKIHLSISGGEPSMSPFLPELVKLFYDHGHTITLTTNGYKSPKYWHELAKMLDWVGFSYHPEFPNSQYFENIAAAAKVTRVSARIMMLNSHWEHAVKIFTKLNADNIYSVVPVRIIDWGRKNGTDYYTPDQLSWFTEVKLNHPTYQHHKPITGISSKFYFSDNTIGGSKDVISYINQGQTNFNGYECDIGLKTLFIDYNGNVRRANCWAGGYIGSINNPEDILWPTHPIICRYNICHCSSDVNVSKRAPLHQRVGDHITISGTPPSIPPF